MGLCSQVQPCFNPAYILPKCQLCLFPPASHLWCLCLGRNLGMLLPSSHGRGLTEGGCAGVQLPLNSWAQHICLEKGGTLIQSFNSFVAVTSCQVWAKLSWSLIFCKFPEAEEQWGHRGPGQPGVPQRAWDPGPGYVNAKDSCRILGVSVAVSCSLVPSWIWGSGCRRYNWHSPFLWVLSPPAAALKGLVGGRGGWAGLWAFWGHQEGSDLCPLCHRSLLGV